VNDVTFKNNCVTLLPRLALTSLSQWRAFALNEKAGAGGKLSWLIKKDTA
jgi:hypothetical protein